MADFGALLMAKDSSGHGVRYYTGGLGYVFGDTNFAVQRHSFQIPGYPGKLGQTPFDGQRIQRCSGQQAAIRAATGYSTDSDRAMYEMGCDMTGGASGAPWITQYAPMPDPIPDFMVSVLSGHLIDSPTIARQGPYLSGYNSLQTFNTICNCVGSSAMTASTNGTPLAALNDAQALTAADATPLSVDEMNAAQPEPLLQGQGSTTDTNTAPPTVGGPVAASGSRGPG